MYRILILRRRDGAAWFHPTFFTGWSEAMQFCSAVNGTNRPLLFLPWRLPVA